MIKPPPKTLVRDGRLYVGQMNREFMTIDELATQLRLQGIDDLSKVKAAYVEPDGRVSVITKDDGGGQGRGPGSRGRPTS